MREIESIFADIIKERKSQNRKWGTYNDSKFSTSDWILAIERQILIAKEATMNDLIKRTRGYGTPTYEGHINAPERILKIAATCTAALQHIRGKEDVHINKNRSRRKPATKTRKKASRKSSQPTARR